MSGADAAIATEVEPVKAISVPWLDAVCVGGVATIAFGMIWGTDFKFEQYAHWTPVILTLQILFNYPHFIASYRLLYQSKEIVRRYPWASMYVPALLLVLLLFGALQPLLSSDPISQKNYWHFLDWVAGINLAFHYGGQAWGMIATFFHLAGTRLQEAERLVLRWVLWVFMGWHLGIANTLSPKYQVFIPHLHPVVVILSRAAPAVAHVAMVITVITFVRLGLRERRLPTIAAMVPIPMLYTGYLVFTRGAEGLLLLQIAHSLQYMLFPLRVEVNRGNDATLARKLIRVGVLWAGLIAVGCLVFQAPNALGSSPFAFAAMTLVTMVNLHHYFIDACVWKISTPEVRRDLFLHLPAQGWKAAPSAKNG